MYFITVDANGYITGLFDGSKDIVHRITGESVEGAVRIPDTAIQISDMCFGMIKTAAPDSKPKWDGTCIVQEPITALEDKRAKLISVREDVVLQAEHDRIQALTEAQVDAE